MVYINFVHVLTGYNYQLIFFFFFGVNEGKEVNFVIFFLLNNFTFYKTII